MFGSIVVWMPGRRTNRAGARIHGASGPDRFQALLFQRPAYPWASVVRCRVLPLTCRPDQYYSVLIGIELLRRSTGHCDPQRAGTATPVEAGATVAGRGSHPLGDGTFPRRSRVGGWRASFRVRWLFRRFRAGPQSGSRGRVSRPPLTEPGVPISGTGLSSGIMRFAHGPPGQGRDRAGEPADRGRCTTAILPPASSPMRCRACSRLDDIEPIEFDSSASACDALRTLGHQGGVLEGVAEPDPSQGPPQQAVERAREARQQDPFVGSGPRRACLRGPEQRHGRDAGA